MFDKQKALENAQRKLGKQQEVLKSTIAELEYLGNTKPTPAALISMLRTKRDRQEAALLATLQLIEIYSGLKKK